MSLFLKQILKSIINIQSIRYWFKKNKNWLGAPGDKRKALENYRISLVIENSTEFLTEKLFDSFFAGCIPVYVGPNIKQFGIPSSLVVTASTNIPSIREAIRRAQSMDYSAWYEELEIWLSKDQTKLDWSTESFFRQLTNLILISASSKR